MKFPSDDEFAKGADPILDRISRHTWEEDTRIALGGAGLSVALVLVLTQLDASSLALRISMFCSALAIPVWTTLWQIGATYSFWAVKPKATFSLRNPFLVGAILFTSGGCLSVTSLATLIGHFSVVSAGAFIVASVAGLVFTFTHHVDVRRNAESNNDRRSPA